MERESTARILALAWIIKVCYAKPYISLTDEFFCCLFLRNNLTLRAISVATPVPHRGFTHLLYYKFSGWSYCLRHRPSHFTMRTRTDKKKRYHAITHRQTTRMKEMLLSIVKLTTTGKYGSIEGFPLLISY